MSLKKVTATQKNAPDLLHQMLENLSNGASPVFSGRSKSVKTALGNKINTTFKLVDLSQLIASHTVNGVENPNYPQELQPRDRERGTSQAWVQKTAADLDPEALGGSSMADRGAPIIGSDYVVESGNGRTMAIQLAYSRGQAEHYKQWLIEEAEYFGFSVDQVNRIKQPVLVRMRNTDIDRVQFAIEANQDDKLSMTNTERAQADANRIDDNMMMLFMPSDDGDLLALSNRKFLGKFAEKLGSTESAQYIDSNSQYTQSFVLRVKQAIFAKAYADERLLEMMADHSKPELQNMINGLAISAPKFIQAKAVSKSVSGQLDDVTGRIVDGMEKSLDQSVLDSIVEASNAIISAKNQNQDINEFVKQQGLFGDLPEGVAEVALFIAQNNRSAKKLGLFFEAMADFVEKQGLDSQNFGLFGEPEPVSVKDAVTHALLVYDAHYKQSTASLFDSANAQLDKISGSQITADLNQSNAVSMMHSMLWALEYTERQLENYGDISVDPDQYVTSSMHVVPNLKNALPSEFAKLKMAHPKKVKEIDISYEPKEGKKLMTQALKKAFPNVKFSIKSSRGSGYRVEWFDGPSKYMVEKITDHFQSRGRGNMDYTGDYWENGPTLTAINSEGQSVFYGIGEVELYRRCSNDFVLAVLAALKAKKVRLQGEDSYIADTNGDLFSFAFVDDSGSEQREIAKLEKNFHGDYYLAAPSSRRWGNVADPTKMFSESRYDLGDLPKATVQMIDQDEQGAVKIETTLQSGQEFLQGILTGENAVHAENIERALTMLNEDADLLAKVGNYVSNYVSEHAQADEVKAYLAVHQKDTVQDQLESALCALAYEESVIEHITKKGKLLKGFAVASKGTKRDELLQYDSGLFRKDGDWFVRLHRLEQLPNEYLSAIQISAKEVITYESTNRNSDNASGVHRQSGGSGDPAQRWNRLAQLAGATESNTAGTWVYGNSDPSVSEPNASGVSSTRDRANERPAGEPSATTANSQRSGSHGQSGSFTHAKRDRAIVSTAQNFAVELSVKAKIQEEANQTPTQWGDMDNIHQALPYLLPEQRDDVFKAEQRLIEKNQNGILFTNGTGTGKTFTGLGSVKRSVNAGKKRILIVTISDKVARDFVKSAKPLGLNFEQLKDLTDNGGTDQNMVVTTFANFGQNDTLVQKEWDLIVVDEAHTLSSNAAGKTTEALKKLRALTGHHAGFNTWIKQKYSEKYPKKSKDHQPSDEEWRAWDNFMEPLKKDWLKNWNNQTGKTKVIFLSATPFAYVPSVEWAEGYLFHFTEPSSMGSPEQQNQGNGYNTANDREHFYLLNFGFRMRYNKLTRPEGKVDSGIFERQFTEKLKKEGALSGRDLVINFDYDRKFVLIESQCGELIDEGLQYLSDTKNVDGASKYSSLSSTINKRFDYITRRKLLEAIKADACVDHVRQHLKLGRKVVIVHDLKVGGGFMPFNLRGGELGNSENEDGSASTIMQEYELFKADRPDLVGLNFQFPPSITTLKGHFPSALVFNGDVSNAVGAKMIDDFNKDDGKHNVLIVQSDKGSTGISLHDTTGKHQRVIVNIGMPTKPTKLRQIEGRTYRTGQASNAIHRYFTTGTQWERRAFSETIAGRAETVDNLAKGEDITASIRQALVEAYENADVNEPSLLDGVGGKATEAEGKRQSKLSGFDKAMTYYYAKGKNTKSRQNREGKDWFATPEPLGFKMLEWAGIHAGDKVLEPSAGDGAIARFAPQDVEMTMVEPSEGLAGRARMANPTAKLIESKFEDLDTVNKYHAIVMNPPFGHAGSLALAHVKKAFEHLYDAGRIVALIPRGAMDDKLANWMAVEKTAYLAGEITLPQSTFKNAGTAVSTRIVLIEKHEFPKDAPHPKYINFTYADSPEDLFKMIRDIDVPKRKPRLDELLAVYGLYLEIDRSKYIYSGPGARKAEIKAIMIRFGDAYADGNDVVMKYNRSKTIINLIKEYELQHKISLALEP